MKKNLANVNTNLNALYDEISSTIAQVSQITSELPQQLEVLKLKLNQ